MMKIDGHDDAIIGPAMVWTEDMWEDWVEDDE